jgi:peptidoglycan/LPS O-acetylase OafA/YrhL
MDRAINSKLAGRPDKKPLRTLTSFRFFASLAIVFFHAVQNPRYDYLASGVSFFFILSGFILTYVHPRINDGVEFARFWIARIARIWPLHILTLIVVIFKHFFSEFFLNLFLLQCWAPVYRVALSFNFVSWSISVELFLYFVFPFLLPHVFKAPGKVFLGTLVLYVALAYGAVLLGVPDIGSINAMSYFAFQFNPALHLYQFVLGMAAFVWWDGHNKSPSSFVTWSFLEVIVVAAIILTIPQLGVLSKAIVAGNHGYLLDRQLAGLLTTPLFALLIYVFAFQAGILSRLFSQSWLVYLGDISFSTYMIHCIVLSQFEKMPISVPPLLKWSLFAITLFCASSLSYGLFEKRSRKLVVAKADSFLRTAVDQKRI